MDTTLDQHATASCLKSDPFSARHVAIIMDGNRRFARKQQISVAEGHFQGAQALVDVVSAAPSYGIEILTVFGFSTENWMRSAEEIAALFEVLRHFLLTQRGRMLEEGVQLKTIGDIKRLPESLQETLQETIAVTSQGTGLVLVLALSYGGRDEMVRSLRSMLLDYEKGKFRCEEVDETLLASYLDTRYFRDPDLIIRTSGEMRVSNFLLWQMAYSELYFTKVLWPEFSPSHLEAATVDFRERSRRKGK